MSAVSLYFHAIINKTNVVRIETEPGADAPHACVHASMLCRFHGLISTHTFQCYVVFTVLLAPTHFNVMSFSRFHGLISTHTFQCYVVFTVLLAPTHFNVMSFSRLISTHTFQCYVVFTVLAPTHFNVMSFSRSY